MPHDNGPNLLIRYLYYISKGYFNVLPFILHSTIRFVHFYLDQTIILFIALFFGNYLQKS